MPVFFFFIEAADANLALIILSFDHPYQRPNYPMVLKTVWPDVPVTDFFPFFSNPNALGL